MKQDLQLCGRESTYSLQQYGKESEMTLVEVREHLRKFVVTEMSAMAGSLLERAEGLMMSVAQL